MNRIDRALGILLSLRSGATLSAAELGRRFEVSPRTIYRDVETLASVGVPVYAELGRGGGYRLVEGFFLPPVAFSTGEATALLVGLSLLRRLRATPFAAELESARRKLLAALPEEMREALDQADARFGFEELPVDLLHPEPDEPDERGSPDAREAAALSIFLRSLLVRAAVEITYRSPYGSEPARFELVPAGLVWDRDRWYLVGSSQPGDELRLWRADRIITIRLGQARAGPAFDVRRLLGRRWLAAAMARWAEESPVVLRLTAAQAERLQRDWYYGHSRFEPDADGRVVVSFGECDRDVVLALVRWLGPGAELLEPRAWRAALRDELAALRDAHADMV